MELWTAGLIGLGGSLHCVGMCGPLALALSRGDGGHGAYVAGRLLYNGGRVTTYALLGGIFGLLGGTLRLAGLQQKVSIALGVLILLTTVLGLAHRRLPGAKLPARLVHLVRTGLGRVLRLQSPIGLYLTGVLNGLLPCGLVYMALAGSLTMDGPQSGIAYMVAFGAGTIPLMLATSLVGRVVAGPSVQQIARKGLPAGMLVLGTLFVLRGLGLDIPYVSPILDGAGGSSHH